MVAKEKNSTYFISNITKTNKIDLNIPQIASSNTHPPLGGKKIQPKTDLFQENCQKMEKLLKEKNQETRKNSFVFAFNTESFSFPSNNNMPP